MFKGYYNVTSGMLSQSRRLDTIANNMTNVSTTGYRAERYVDSTFQEHIISRVGNKDKTGSVELGGGSYILAPSQIYTDFSQGYLESTGLALDFAIEGNGFFAIQTDGGLAYTRSGNFSLDDEGYLCLPGEGRVLDANGDAIYLGTDKITVDPYGGITNETGDYVTKLGVFTFPDNDALTRNDRGLFVGAGAVANNEVPIHWKTQERSNIELVDQMVAMMSSQRALQSAAQLSKMFDQLMTKATTEIGRM